MVSAGKSLLKPGGRALEGTIFCNCGFIKLCIHFSNKTVSFMPLKRTHMRVPLLNLYAASVSYAVCLQRVLIVIKVFLCLLCPFLLKKSSLKSTFALKTLKSLMVNTNISLKLGTYQLVQICEVFWGDPYPV